MRIPIGKILVFSFLAFLAWIPLSRSNMPLMYDESVYIGVSRQIAETGKPLRRQYPADTPFFTHPPLVILASAPAHLFWPGNIEAIRLVHFFLFVLPTLVAIALIGWKLSEKSMSAVSAFSALVCFWLFDRVIEQAERVVLDLALGGACLIGLYTYSQYLSRPSRARAWGLAIATGIAVAIKFQAVTLVAAFLCFSIGECLKQPERKKMILHVKALGIAGAGSVGFLVVIAGYFLWSDFTAVASHFSGQLARFTQEGGPALDVWGVARQLKSVLVRTAGFIGLPILILYFLGTRGKIHRSMPWRLGLSFFGTTVAFNLLAHRLPGAGTYYLTAVIPTVSVMGGLLISRCIAQRESWALAGAVFFLIGLHFVQQDWIVPRRIANYKDNFESIGKLIHTTTERGEGVLAFHPEIGTYADRRIGLIQYLNDDELYDLISRPSSHAISHVVIPQGYRLGLVTRPRGIEITDKLRETFEWVPAFQPVEVWRRREGLFNPLSRIQSASRVES